MYKQSSYQYCLSIFLFIFCIYLTLIRINQMDLASVLTPEEMMLFQNSFILLKGIPLLVEICMYSLNLFILALIYKFIKVSFPFSFALLIYMISNTISKLCIMANFSVGISIIIFWGVYLALLYFHIKDTISIKQGYLLLLFPCLNIILSFL